MAFPFEEEVLDPTMPLLPAEEEPEIAEPTTSNISEDYDISEEKLEEIVQNVTLIRDRADQFYEDELEADIIKRHKIFESDKQYYNDKFPKLTRVSDVTASDMHDTIEWAIPSLIKVFFGGEDICKLQGARTEKDEESAVAHTDLIKYQLERHNEGFLVFYDWIKNAMVDNLGIVKCYWERSEESQTCEVVCSPEQLIELQSNPKVSIITVEEVAERVLKVQYEEITKVTKNQPVLEVVPPSEFRFSPDAKTLDNIDYVAHRKIVTLDYLRRREAEGIFQNIDKVLDEEGSDGSVSRTNYETSLNPRAYNLLENGQVEEAKREFLLYECYVKTDVNDDGMLEDVIITMVGNTVVRLEENTMGRHPFFAISPIRDPLRLFPKRGIADLVGELQDLNTALLKQIIINVANNNDKQAFINVDVMVDPNEFLDGKKGVRVNGDPSQAVKWSPIEPLQPQVFQFLEMLQGMKENRTGITRYNQGMDGSTLNKTARGITAIMNASNQRLELIATLFAETGVKQLFRHMIKMNQMFIDDDTFIRVTGKPKVIKPEDLGGEIDIVVNIGIASGTKEQQFSNLQLLLQMYPQAVQAGVADPSHIAYAFGRIIESMGYKNTSDFVFPADLLREAQAQGVPPQMLIMMKQAQETGVASPALEQMQQQLAMKKAMEATGINPMQQQSPQGGTSQNGKPAPSTQNQKPNNQ